MDRAPCAQVAADAFGTGSSALSYVQHLPLSRLKIRAGLRLSFAYSPKSAAAGLPAVSSARPKARKV